MHSSLRHKLSLQRQVEEEEEGKEVVVEVENERLSFSPFSSPLGGLSMVEDC